MPVWTSTASASIPSQGRDLLSTSSWLGSDTEPGLGPCTVPLGWQEPSMSNTQHQHWWGSFFCKQPQMLPKLEVLGAPGMQHTQGSGRSSVERGWGHHCLCLEKVLLCWVTLSDLTFFRGFIASFQSDCAGERVQKQMDPLSVSLLHIISYSLGAIKLPGRTNLQACAVPYF